ncbi:flagellar hook-basal body complex protein FliE [Tunturiibacter psychrotolerans]
MTIPSGLSAASIDDGFLSDVGVATSNSGGGGSGVPFADVLESIVRQTEQLQHDAGKKIKGLIDGSGVEIHDALIAGQKASLASQLVIQMRNKAVGAYQQMWDMQI